MKAKTVEKVPSFQNGKGDRKAHEFRGRCHKSDIYDYVTYKTNPTHVDKDYKHRLRNCSKFFKADRGKLYYFSGEKCKRNPAWWWRGGKGGGK